MRSSICERSPRGSRRLVPRRNSVRQPSLNARAGLRYVSIENSAETVRSARRYRPQIEQAVFRVRRLWRSVPYRSGPEADLIPERTSFLAHFELSETFHLPSALIINH